MILEKISNEKNYTWIKPTQGVLDFTVLAFKQKVRTKGLKSLLKKIFRKHNLTIAESRG